MPEMSSPGSSALKFLTIGETRPDVYCKPEKQCSGDAEESVAVERLLVQRRATYRSTMAASA